MSNIHQTSVPAGQTKSLRQRMTGGVLSVVICAVSSLPASGQGDPADLSLLNELIPARKPVPAVQPFENELTLPVGGTRRPVEMFVADVDVAEEVVGPANRNPFGGVQGHFGTVQPFAAQTERETADKPKKLSPFEQAVEDWHAVDAELVRLKVRPQPADRAAERVYVVPSSGYHGFRHYGNNQQQRFVAFKLHIANATKQPVVIRSDSVELTADGKPYVLKDLPSELSSFSYNNGEKSVRSSELKFPEEVKLAPGAVFEGGMVFTRLPMKREVAKMTLSWKVSIGKEKPVQQTLSLNEYFRGQLKMDVRRLGPHACLALLSIDGELNSLNVASLLEELDRLTDDQVSRVVLEWSGDASPIDSEMVQWLFDSAAKSGSRSERNDHQQFPMVPAFLREFHLAQVPKRNQNYVNAGQRHRIHDETAVAVTSALRSAYAAIPLQELLDALQSDDLLIRSAAIGGGGHRLPADKLPLLIRLSEGDQQELKRAAIVALSNYGDDVAIKRLEQVIQFRIPADQQGQPAGKEAESLKELAIIGLAVSRFPQAQESLLRILKTAETELRLKIVEVIARNPQPQLADPVYEMAQQLNSPLGHASLKALLQMGDPRLPKLLQRALREGDQAARDIAFNHLCQQDDARSQQVALEYTLEHMRKTPPTSTMQALIRRTKDRRAIPLLISHLTKKSNRSSSLQLLAAIGDQSTARVLVAQYPALTANEQAIVLQGLKGLDDLAARDLAADAVMSKDSSLVRAGCEVLKRDGSDQSVALLARAARDGKQSYVWSYSLNALGQIGTPAAREFLKEFEKDKNSSKKSYASNALRQIRQRSPAYQYIYRGQYYARQNQLKEAIESYSFAIESLIMEDSTDDFPEAYLGRGSAYLKNKKYKEALADYQHIAKDDPDNHTAATGVAISQVMLGQLDAGLDHLEKFEQRKSRNQDNINVYHYNVACVYSRALEAARKNEKLPKRDELIKQYEAQAVESLQAAIKAGYSKFSELQTDEDLKPLKDSAGFQQILKDKEVKKVAVPNAAGRVRQVLPEG